MDAAWEQNAVERVEPLSESGGLVSEEAIRKVLTFMLADEEYAFDILAIEEITRPLAVTHVPRVPPHVVGVVSLRGRVIPMVDLHVRLGLSAFVSERKNRFIICQTEHSTVGVVADKINGIVALSPDQLKPPPAKITASGSGYTKNIARLRDRIVMVLDIEKVLQIG